MTDDALVCLCDHLGELPGRKLLIADEQLDSSLLLRLTGSDVTILTNRFDVHQYAQGNRLQSQFNDMDLATCDGKVDLVAYRVSKEKALVHHIINQAPRVLKPQGQLVICGYKNEGIKTYISKAESYLGAKASITKGPRHLKIASFTPLSLGEVLDDRDYGLIRPIDDNQATPIYSKPGQFGWNKIDAGSQLLAESLLQQDKPSNNPSVLDLGCGYGYLSLTLGGMGFSQIVATDNNAAALACCQKNFDAHAIKGEVIAADCADVIHQRFDWVVCNPPFHRGFAHEKSLTEKFLKSAKSHLKNSGTAFFVVNEFIPIESAAAPYFHSLETLGSEAGFKVLRLQQ